MDRYQQQPALHGQEQGAFAEQQQYIPVQPVQYYPVPQQQLPVPMQQPAVVYAVPQPAQKSGNVFSWVVIAALVWLVADKFSVIDYIDYRASANKASAPSLDYGSGYQHQSQSQSVSFLVSRKAGASASGKGVNVGGGIGYVPADVVAEARYWAAKRGIEPAVLLAIAWHERGTKGWHDDFLFGYGACDKCKEWQKKYSGWKNQFEFASKKAEYFRGKTISVRTFQLFAKNIYKTTDWQNYRNAMDYYNLFKAVI